MRYVLMTYHSPEHAEAWERSTAEEKRLEIERTMAWFRAQHEASRIVGGEELGRARSAKVVRAGGVSDGPFVETKEQLGGFIVLEVPDEATALTIAAAWPGLTWPGDAVEVRPAGDSVAEAEADAQAVAGATPP
jgi:hypothetical protein